MALLLSPQGIFSSDTLSRPHRDHSSKISHCLRKRWKLVSHLVQSIWRRWRTLYLQSLNNFSKWRAFRPNLQVGVKDTTLVKSSWPLGVVTKVLPGSDGVVRVVDVRCNNKEYHRSANRLVLLFSSDQPNLPAREDVQA